MSKHKQPGGIWTAQYAHCAVEPLRSPVKLQGGKSWTHRSTANNFPQLVH